MTRLASILLILFALAHHAAGQAIVGKTYVVDVPDTKAYHLDPSGKTKKDTQAFHLIKKGTKFTVLEIVEDGFVVKFWSYRPDEAFLGIKYKKPVSTINTIADLTKYEITVAYIDEKNNGRHYLIEVKDVDEKCSEYHSIKGNFTWGPVTVPLKMRFGRVDTDTMFSLSGNMNLGLFVGYRQQFKGRKTQALNFLLGASGGSVALREEDIEGATEDPEPDNTLALSATLGVVYQYETFQVGLFSGLDFIPYELGRSWKYQGMPWLGVGIGIGLFSSGKTEINGKGKNREQQE